MTITITTPAVAAGDDATAAWANDVATDLTALAAFANTGISAARAHLSVDETMVSNTWTAINFSVSDYDTAGIKTAPNTFTAPTTGYYVIDAAATVGCTGAQACYFRIYKNNTTEILRNDVNGNMNAGGIPGSQCSFHDILHLTAGDYLRLEAFPCSYGPDVFSNIGYTQFAIAKIG